MTVETLVEQPKTALLSGSVEAKFAQRLAANEKKQRDRALKKLRQYLIARSSKSDGGFVRDDLVKIWKGLFYCMWMSDKPLIQEELAKQIAAVLPQLRNIKTCMMYFETFLETMHREWQGIDRLRMDKFFLLCRFMLQSLFKCLKENQWEQGLTDWAVGVIKNGPFSPLAPGPSKTTGPPLGLRYHFIDVYLDELSSVTDENLTSKEVILLLTPLAQLVCRTPVKDLRNKAMEKIFQEIIDQSEPAQKLIHEVNELEENEIQKPSLPFDYTLIADLLFETANNEMTLARNRKKVYAMVKKLRGIAEGQMPLDDLPDILPDEDYNSQQLEESIRKNLESELNEEHSTGKMEKKQHNKTKKKKKSTVDDSICEADIMDSAFSADTTIAKPNKNTCEVKKKAKQIAKNKNSASQASESGSDMEAIIIGSSSDLNESVFESSEVDSTVLELNEGSKTKNPSMKTGKKKKKFNTDVMDTSKTIALQSKQPLLNQTKSGKKRKSLVESPKLSKKQKLLQLLNDNKAENPDIKPSAIEQNKSVHDANTVEKKSNLDQKQEETSPNTEESSFATFVASPPKPVTSSFLRVASSKVARKQKKTTSAAASKRKSLPADIHSAKRVSFEMSKIQVKPFCKNDKSSAVSPSPSSVAFDPNKTPDFGLLKQKKTKPTSVQKSLNSRKSAADFF